MKLRNYSIKPRWETMHSISIDLYDNIRLYIEFTIDMKIYKGVWCSTSKQFRFVSYVTKGDVYDSR